MRAAITIALLLTGCGRADDLGIQADPHVLPPATGVDVAWVAVYQNQEQVLHDVGVAPHVGSNPPILAGRDLRVRVGVDRVDSSPAREIAVLLQVKQGNKGAVNHVELGRVTRPDADDLGSTYNFVVPGDEITPGLKLEVSLREIDFRMDRSAPLGDWEWTSAFLEVENTDTIDLVIVPIAIQDGPSETTPDTSAAQLDLIEQMVEAQYPIAGVNISVDEPMTWLGSFGNASDWGEILDRVSDRRDGAEVRENTYFYGAIAPADPYGSSGIAGLSNLAGPGDSWARSSVGWGYSGPESVEVLLHEVGHAHGRSHVACGGAAGADPGYPHDPSIIGIRVWDPVTNELIGPTDAADTMSYCQPTYVSDYTFAGMHSRVLALRGQRRAQPLELRKARLDGDGTLHPSGTVRVGPDLLGEPITLTAKDSDGLALPPIEGWFYPYDHLPGGTLLY